MFPDERCRQAHNRSVRYPSPRTIRNLPERQVLPGYHVLPVGVRKDHHLERQGQKYGTSLRNISCSVLNLLQKYKKIGKILSLIREIPYICSKICRIFALNLKYM